MDKRIVYVGIFVLVLGIVFIGVSKISYEKGGGHWDQGDGTTYYEGDSSTIFLESNDRWTIENITYLLWLNSTNQSITQPTDDLQISLYTQNGSMVDQIPYGDLKKLPTGRPVQNFGLYTIKIENIGSASRYTISATYVRLVYKTEIVSPYSYLLIVGIPVTLGGVATTACGAFKRSRARKTKQKSTLSYHTSARYVLHTLSGSVGTCIASQGAPR